MKKILLAALILLPVLSYANTSCVGKVSGVSVSRHSDVYVSIIGNGNGVNILDSKICSLKTVINGFDAEACQATLSLLMKAASMKQSAQIWFTSDEQGICNGSWMDLTLSGFYHIKIHD